MSAENPRREHFQTFKEYKEKKEGAYSADQLSHYFNSELGIASNLIHTLRAVIKQPTTPPELASAILSKIDAIIEHLVTVHEIGNVSFDLLLEKEEKP